MSNQQHIVIVGGGPAGLIAAETLAAQGFGVTVYEQRRSVGRKFLLAGRGGLNITHSEPVSDLLARFGAASSRMAQAVDAFSPDDLRAWCEGLGEPTFVGTSGRVFPESFRATPLLRSWLGRLQSLEVQIRTGHRWTGWSDSQALTFVADDGEHQVEADAVIFALGGASWSRVGGDGSWVDEFRGAAIDVTPLAAANCGVLVAWSSVLRARFAGHPIKNTVFTVGEQSVRGDAVITESGLEGGPIYALGPALRESLAASGTAQLRLDTQPDVDLEQVNNRLAKRRPKSSASSWLKSAGLSPLVIALLREITNNDLPNDPERLAVLTKSLPIAVTAMASIDRAISSAGGVTLAAVDDNWMVKHRPGVFVAGEMLDWEAPTGGYLLQGCFSTGVAVANGVTRWLQTQSNATG